MLVADGQQVHALLAFSRLHRVHAGVEERDAIDALGGEPKHLEHHARPY